MSIIKNKNKSFNCTLDLQYDDYNDNITSLSDIEPFLNKEYKWSDFDDLIKIGEGGLSIIYKAKYKIDDKYYALKVISFDKIFALSKDNLKLYPNLNDESIIRCYGCFINEEYNLVYVLEYILGQDLFDYLNLFENVLELNDKKKIMYSMVKSIKYCHDNNIIHLDVKLENFMINIGNNILKLGDFDFILDYKSNQSIYHRSRGTLDYMAPEVLVLDHIYDKSSDIWSLGVCFYIFLVKNMPFNSEDPKILINKILNKEPNYNRIKNILGRDLVSKMLNKNPKERINIDDVYNHDFFKN